MALQHEREPGSMNGVTAPERANHSRGDGKDDDWRQRAPSPGDGAQPRAAASAPVRAGLVLPPQHPMHDQEIIGRREAEKRPVSTTANIASYSPFGAEEIR